MLNGVCSLLAMMCGAGASIRCMRAARLIGIPYLPYTVALRGTHQTNSMRSFRATARHRLHAAVNNFSIFFFIFCFVFMFHVCRIQFVCT